MQGEWKREREKEESSKLIKHGSECVPHPTRIKARNWIKLNCIEGRDGPKDTPIKTRETSGREERKKKWRIRTIRIFHQKYIHTHTHTHTHTHNVSVYCRIVPDYVLSCKPHTLYPLIGTISSSSSSSSSSQERERRQRWSGVIWRILPSVVPGTTIHTLSTFHTDCKSIVLRTNHRRV